MRGETLFALSFSSFSQKANKSTTSVRVRVETQTSASLTDRSIKATDNFPHASFHERSPDNAVQILLTSFRWLNSRTKLRPINGNEIEKVGDEQRRKKSVTTVKPYATNGETRDDKKTKLIWKIASTAKES